MIEDSKQTPEDVTPAGAVQLEESKLEDAAGGLPVDAALKLKIDFVKIAPSGLKY